MIESCSDLLLALKAIEENRIGLDFRVRHLQRNLLPGASIGSAKDGRHAAAGNQGIYLVMVKLVAGADGCHVRLS